MGNWKQKPVPHNTLSLQQASWFPLLQERVEVSAQEALCLLSWRSSTEPTKTAAFSGMWVWLALLWPKKSFHWPAGDTMCLRQHQSKSMSRSPLCVCRCCVTGLGAITVTVGESVSRSLGLFPSTLWLLHSPFISYSLRPSSEAHIFSWIFFLPSGLLRTSLLLS